MFPVIVCPKMLQIVPYLANIQMQFRRPANDSSDARRSGFGNFHKDAAVFMRNHINQLYLTDARLIKSKLKNKKTPEVLKPLDALIWHLLIYFFQGFHTARMDLSE